MRNISDKSCTENQNTVSLKYLFLFCFVLSKILRLRDNVQEYGDAKRITDDNMIYSTEDAICAPDNLVKNTDS